MVQVQERITALLDADPARLGQTQLQDTLLAVHAATAMLSALAARLTTELTERGATTTDGTYVDPRAWLGDQLATDHWQSRLLLRRADRLRQLPRLAQALAAGQLSTEHADTITRLLGVLPPDAHTDAETILLAAALAGATPRDLMLLLREIRHRVNPDTTTDAALRREEEQNLHLTEYGDGNLAVRGTLDPISGAAVLAALLPHAEPHGTEDTRSPARRLADAWVHLCSTHQEDPTREPRRPELIVLTPADVLTPPDAQPSPTDADPAAAGAGDRPRPVDPAAAVLAETRTLLDDPAVQTLACTGTLRRLVLAPAPRPTAGALDPASSAGPLWTRWIQGLRGILPAVITGPSAVLDLGRSRRLASRDQWLALVARDAGCVIPGCHAPPSWCDLHHLLEWHADHGPTDLTNLAMLCRHHHLDLHRRGQHLRTHPDRGWYRTSDQATRAHHAA